MSSGILNLKSLSTNRKMMKSFLSTTGAKATIDSPLIAEFLDLISDTPYTYEEFVYDFKMWSLNTICELPKTDNLHMVHIRSVLSMSEAALKVTPEFEELMSDVIIRGMVEGKTLHQMAADAIEELHNNPELEGKLVVAVARRVSEEENDTKSFDPDPDTIPFPRKGGFKA
jgi:hypothetical protein